MSEDNTFTTLADTARQLTSEGRFPSMITLYSDDGLESDYTKLKPILDKYGFVATIGVIAGSIGDSGFLTADQIRELQQQGWEIASHSQSHAPLAAFAPQSVTADANSGQNVVRVPTTYFSKGEKVWIYDDTHPHGENRIIHSKIDASLVLTENLTNTYTVANNAKVYFNDATIGHEVAKSLAHLDNIGCCPVGYIMPYGWAPPRVMHYVANHYLWARAASNTAGYSAPQPRAPGLERTPSAIRRYSLGEMRFDESSQVADVKTAIHHLSAQGGWLGILTHSGRIDAGGGIASTEYDEVMALIHSLGIRVVTPSWVIRNYAPKLYEVSDLYTIDASGSRTFQVVAPGNQIKILAVHSFAHHNGNYTVAAKYAHQAQAQVYDDVGNQIYPEPKQVFSETYTSGGLKTKVLSQPLVLDSRRGGYFGVTIQNDEESGSDDFTIWVDVEELE